jgi:oligogalacturonide lyase
MARRSFLGQLGGMALAGAVARAASAQVLKSVVSNGPKGSTHSIAAEMKEYKDPETGARVVQLTGDGSDNVHLYFTSESFLKGGADRIVFGSSRSKRFQFYLMEIRDKKLIQLTDGANVDPQSACLDPGGRLFYFDGPAMRSLKVDTLEDRELYKVPQGWKAHLATCTAKGDYVAFTYRDNRELSTETGRIYSTMPETFFQHPDCVIMRIQTSNGQPMAVWGEHAWISHVMIHPHQPDLIMFCHEGGSLSKQRMWTVNVAATRDRKAEKLYPQRPGEYCVHEYFTRQGEVGFQYEVERNGKMEHYNCFIRPDGTWIRQYLLPGKRPGHIQSNTANTLVVGDCGYLSMEDKEGANFISLMTHANGIATVRRLCRRKPGETQHSHGHPVFSADDRWVLFNSRIGDKDNLFMADVESI